MSAKLPAWPWNSITNAIVATSATVTQVVASGMVVIGASNSVVT